MKRANPNGPAYALYLPDYFFAASLAFFLAFFSLAVSFVPLFCFLGDLSAMSVYLRPARNCLATGTNARTDRWWASRESASPDQHTRLPPPCSVVLPIFFREAAQAQRPGNGAERQE